MDKLIKEYFSIMGKKGVAKRFAGKTTEEIAEIMRKVSKANKKNRV